MTKAPILRPLYALAFLLNFGRALTFTEAIRSHNNEALGAMRAFFNLSDQEKQQLLTFLKSL